MKKLVALMLAMAMLLSVAAFAGTDEYLGTWYLNEMVMGDVTMVEHPFEPEINHTAYGILSDLLRLLTELNR